MYRVEIHAHSTASDGKPTPRELVKAALRIGLSGLAVTDHNTFQGSIIAAREARGSGLIIVYGNEVRTRWGDALLLCPEPPRAGYGWKGIDPLALREEAEGWGCILVAAHPYHLGRSSVGRRAWRRDVFHAVEVWNARGPPILNLPAIICSRVRGAPSTSGSDAHVLGELGVAPILLEDEPRGPGDIIEAVARGRVRPTYGLPGIGAVREAVSWAVERRFRGS